MPSETEPNGVQLSSGTSSSEVKTVQAKLTKDQPYYVYTTTGNIHISKLQYTANAPSAQVNEDGTVNLVTTEEMEGWRTFYDASNSYQVKENTNTKDMSNELANLNKIADKLKQLIDYKKNKSFLKL